MARDAGQVWYRHGGVSDLDANLKSYWPLLVLQNLTGPRHFSHNIIGHLMCLMWDVGEGEKLVRGQESITKYAVCPDLSRSSPRHTRYAWPVCRHGSFARGVRRGGNHILFSIVIYLSFNLEKCAFLCPSHRHGRRHFLRLSALLRRVTAQESSNARHLLLKVETWVLGDRHIVWHLSPDISWMTEW